jgi:hypothetical protein
MFMLVAWVMGIGIGLIFTFLFWHLQVTLSKGTVSGELALDIGVVIISTTDSGISRTVTLSCM